MTCPENRITIRPCKTSDHQSWDNYVLTHPQGTFFHLTGWKNLIEKSFGHKSHYLIAETPCRSINSEQMSSSMRVSWVFPLFSIKSFLFGKAMVSVPFATYGGILADNEDIEQALYKYATDITKTENLDYLEIRSEHVSSGNLPEKNPWCTKFALSGGRRCGSWNLQSRLVEIQPGSIHGNLRLSTGGPRCSSLQWPEKGPCETGHPCG